MEHSTTPDQDRIRAALYFGLALILALVIVASFAARTPPAPPQADYYRPDPPMVDNSWEINIGSKNQVCIGWRDIC